MRVYYNFKTDIFPIFFATNQYYSEYYTVSLNITELALLLQRRSIITYLALLLHDHKVPVRNVTHIKVGNVILQRILKMGEHYVILLRA